MTTTMTIEGLQQHQLVILRRLRAKPLTEFELAAQVAEHSGWDEEQASDKMSEWLNELRSAGLIWAGELTNDSQQVMMVAVLTKAGWEVVCA